MRLLLIDNYDSFTYNLYQLFLTSSESSLSIDVLRNDQQLSLETISEKYAGLIISPGPGGPRESGISAEAVTACQARIPILGVCLGHQLLAWLHGVPVECAPTPMHGKTSLVYHQGGGILQGVPSPFKAMRYHSLHVPRTFVPEIFSVDAESDDSVVMALAHRSYPVWGVQFHPESFLTEYGALIARNFLKRCQN